MLILVEWESRKAFKRYLDAPVVADLHPHREKGAGNYIRHLFDRLEDLRPLLKVQGILRGPVPRDAGKSIHGRMRFRNPRSNSGF